MQTYLVNNPNLALEVDAKFKQGIVPSLYTPVEINDENVLMWMETVAVWV